MATIRYKTTSDALDFYATLPPTAREEALALMTGITDPKLKANLIKLLSYCRRDRVKRDSDRDGDRYRRTLAGAHLPRWRVEQYKALAEEAHMSLHAWVTTALEAQAYRQGAGTLRNPEEPARSAPGPALAPAQQNRVFC